MIQQQQNSEQASEATSALHRKVRVGKADHQARAMSLPKALRLSLAKVADELCDMAMAVIGIRAQTCKADELTSHLQGTTLLMLMDGPQRRRGAAAGGCRTRGGGKGKHEAREERRTLKPLSSAQNCRSRDEGLIFDRMFIM